MTHAPILRFLARRAPRLLSGARIHRLALEALHRGRFRDAERLFEAGAARYRAELRVEPLARLRVHQGIARVRSGLHPQREAEWALEVESLLGRLDHIEALAPPFALVPAGSLLAVWIDGAAPAVESGEEPAELRRAA